MDCTDQCGPTACFSISSATSTLSTLYSARAQDCPQDMERNEAAARNSRARQHAWLLLSFFPYPVGNPEHEHCTQKCRFMDKRVCEISRFFVAPPRVFPLSVWCVSRTLLSRNISTIVYISCKTVPFPPPPDCIT